MQEGSESQAGVRTRKYLGWVLKSQSGKNWATPCRKALARFSVSFLSQLCAFLMFLLRVLSIHLSLCLLCSALSVLVSCIVIFDGNTICFHKLVLWMKRVAALVQRCWVKVSGYMVKIDVTLMQFLFVKYIGNAKVVLSSLYTRKAKCVFWW